MSSSPPFRARCSRRSSPATSRGRSTAPTATGCSPIGRGRSRSAPAASSAATEVSLSGFRIPDVSSDIPYPEFDDVFATALLEANDAALDDDALTAALDSPIEVLRAAAARTLGARGVRSAIGRLETAAAAGDGTDRAEAAYALARMGETEA